MTRIAAWRVIALLALVALLASIPPWRRPGIPQPPPAGFGAAVAYGLGGVKELDALGAVWYVDYDYQGPVLGSHRRIRTVNPGSNLDDLRAVARGHPGDWWQIGNEPNDAAQDHMSPAEYARRYRQVYYAIKSVDSTARIVPAGLADADWKWANAFRETYRSGYGEYPRVAGWNIHNYGLETCPSALDFDLFRDRIIAFRDWLARTGDAAKPLFLTEFGVLYGNGCCRCPEVPDEQLTEYMRATIEWMEETHLIQGWAWFALRTDGRYNGDLFDSQGTFTPAGRMFSELVRTMARNRRAP